MSGDYEVLLVINTYKDDYHWYRQESDGTWSHKMEHDPVSTGVADPIKDAQDTGYTTMVGYYNITEACNGG